MANEADESPVAAPDATQSTQPYTGAQPPPLPPKAIEYATPDTVDPVTPYQHLADTVGFVPTLRWRDNLYQLAAGAAGAAVGFLFMPFLMPRAFPPTVCAILGCIGGIVIFGIALGIVRYVGAVRRRR